VTSYRSRVGAEFLGLARVFRQTVVAADAELNAALRPIVVPLMRRLERKTSLRPDTAIDTARVWEGMTAGQRFRLGFTANANDGRSLTIDEVRVSSISFRDNSWDDPSWEPGVSITKVSLTADGQLKLQVTPLVVTSLHSLGRYIERSGNRDHDLLVADLLPLLQATRDERIAAGPGAWLGGLRKVYGADDKRCFVVRNVRTYVTFPERQPRQRLPEPLTATA
jgi:hypothetical protein